MIFAVEQKGVKMDDLINRQDAIDIERRATVDTNPEHFESHQKFVEFMDNAEISSFGRWQWSNGFNTALTAVGIDLKRLPSVQPESAKNQIDHEITKDVIDRWKSEMSTSPIMIISEQPEIIRCKDCKYMTEHYDTDGNAPYWTCSEWDSGTDYDGFCHYAERRTDE